MISALRAAIEKIPTREERLGGQTFKYVKISEVLDLLDTFRSSNADETAGCRIGVMLCVHCGKENRVAVEPKAERRSDLRGHV